VHRVAKTALLLFLITGLIPAAPAQTSTSPGSFTVVFKDGHRQSFNLADIERLEFPAAIPAGLISVPSPSRGHFIGKWEVGQGNGTNFYITLRDDGTAWRSLGNVRGTWQYVNGAAEVTWNDGAQDAIRKVGVWYRKFAYPAGRSFADTPDNVTNARNLSLNPSGVD
jgi:hypothetical protein